MPRMIDDGELPGTPRVGDRVKLKESRLSDYIEACRKAGWGDANLHEAKTVTREDDNNPGGGYRLFFEGRPFCYASADVVLAWNSTDERRAGLRKAGHKV